MRKLALPVCGVQLENSLDANLVSIMSQYVSKREHKNTLLQCAILMFAVLFC